VSLATAPLRVLVTNDDGFDAPGIDALVEGLRKVPNTEVTVVAPATNQSGTGGKTTPGGVTSQPAKTASGYEAVSVAGFPADAVEVAFDTNKGFNLVISGINKGQNVGSLTNISGTVGAARAGVAKGVPALAVSQGAGDSPDFPTGVRLALEWVADHRTALLVGRSFPVTVANLNIPTCPSGEVRGVVEVPAAADAEGAGDTPNCASTEPATSATTDIAAFKIGFASLSELPAKG